MADTALAPALGIELNDLEPGMRAIRVTVIVQERQLLGRRRRACPAVRVGPACDVGGGLL